MYVLDSFSCKFSSALFIFIRWFSFLVYLSFIEIRYAIVINQKKRYGLWKCLYLIRVLCSCFLFIFVRNGFFVIDVKYYFILFFQNCISFMSNFLCLNLKNNNILAFALNMRMWKLKTWCFRIDCHNCDNWFGFPQMFLFAWFFNLFFSSYSLVDTVEFNSTLTLLLAQLIVNDFELHLLKTK